MLWLKHLTPKITGNEPCKVVVFTARVGSISDNKLGGWYSYRASKAAMNMLLTSATVELARREKTSNLSLFIRELLTAHFPNLFKRMYPKVNYLPASLSLNSY